MGKFIIEPHFRLHEWVAEEKGYFTDEGLDYKFLELVQSTDGQNHNTANKVGAYQVIEEGRKSDVSCACHWTVNVAASAGHAKLYADVYSVSPSGIFVPADSPVRTPEDLAGVPISVGFRSGSHYSTIQALEQYLERDRINLTFEDGMLFRRLELLIEGKSQAAALFSGPYYLVERLGFKHCDGFGGQLVRVAQLEAPHGERGFALVGEVNLVDQVGSARARESRGRDRHPHLDHGFWRPIGNRGRGNGR